MVVPGDEVNGLFPDHAAVADLGGGVVVVAPFAASPRVIAGNICSGVRRHGNPAWAFATPRDPGKGRYAVAFLSTPRHSA